MFRAVLSQTWDRFLADFFVDHDLRASLATDGVIAAFSNGPDAATKLLRTKFLRGRRFYAPAGACKLLSLQRGAIAMELLLRGMITA